MERAKIINIMGGGGGSEGLLLAVSRKLKQEVNLSPCTPCNFEKSMSRT